MMKKFFTLLGMAVAAAAVIPYRVKKDEATETTTVDALLWQLTLSPAEDEDGERQMAVDVNLGLKSRQEDDFEDQEEEAPLLPLEHTAENLGE